MQKEDFSYGIIPIRKKEGGKFHVFIIRHLSGFWGFPKGHRDQGEEPLQAAIRELREETKLEILLPLLSKKILKEYYSFRSGKDWIFKTVDYFIAEVENPDDFEIDRSEVSEGKWVDINEAPMHLTYEEGRKICREVAQIVQVT